MIEDDAPAVTWDDRDSPRSALYGDVYFSSEDGLAESRAVFLAGCRLPQAWAARARFTVAELGFGTGLNIVALIDLWRRGRAPGAHLSVFSVEAHPIAAADAARALARWPEQAVVAQAILAQWPRRARGFHRIDLPQWGASIDIAIMEALEALQAWSGAADAWFLDGFSPALNPAMWRRELLALAAARSAPGARAASFTVAGQVRRDLQAAGFSVERAPGFGRKRRRLEAVLPGDPAAGMPGPRVAIIGAGIAGASLARAFTALGAETLVIDAAGAGAGASGGPAALAAARLDAGLAANAGLFAQGLARARDLYASTPGAILARGAEQSRVGPKDAARFAAIAGSDLFEPGAMALSPAGLRMETALVVEPASVLRAWLGEMRRGAVERLERDETGWRLLDGAGATIARADVVCLAAGMDCARLAPGLPLHPVRGQASIADGLAWREAKLFGAYVLPTRTGLLFGATHDRDDTDIAPREADHVRNRQALAAALPELAAELADKPLGAWTGIRATTRDYLPLAGAVPGAGPGLFVLGGLGSRGFTLAPLLAEHVAATALAVPSPLPRPLAELVDPARFERRARRRGRA